MPRDGYKVRRKDEDGECRKIRSVGVFKMEYVPYQK